MAFRGFTEEDLSKINSVKLESDSGSDYDDVEEEEERDENTTEKGASASFSGHHRKQKTLGSMNVKSLLFSQRIHIPMEAMLSVSNTETSKPLDVDAKPPVRSSTFAPSPSETNNDVSSDYASHSPSEASSCAGSPNKKTPAVASTVNGEPNSPSLDDSSSDADFSQLKLVLNSYPTPSPPHPSSIGVKLDLATVKSLPLDWDNTSSLNALIEFEQNRKKLEDLNDRKKKELKKALEEKAKKTEEDMKKISEISQELKKLDSNLSNDVSILRKQIEVASYDFNEAQKRFEKAEKEYLVAKLELFTKREKKELLTGHLCSIIEQNEFRKAKKLSDLMGQLEIGSKELTQQACSSPKEDTADTNSGHKDVSTPT